MLGALTSFAGLIVAAVAFFAGRAISESEKVLASKRRVYEEFLRVCPVPNDANQLVEDDDQAARTEAVSRVYSALILYCAPKVAQAISLYLEKFAEADAILQPDSPALHDVFQSLARAHNDMILEMRRDALAWSAFGYYGKSRLPDLQPDIE